MSFNNFARHYDSSFGATSTYQEDGGGGGGVRWSYLSCSCTVFSYAKHSEKGVSLGTTRENKNLDKFIRAAFHQNREINRKSGMAGNQLLHENPKSPFYTSFTRTFVIL